MKTLEFKLTLTLAQQQTIDLWLDQLRWIWNEGLSLLEEDQQRKWREKNPVESDAIRYSIKTNNYYPDLNYAEEDTENYFKVQKSKNQLSSHFKHSLYVQHHEQRSQSGNFARQD